jgi:hypothetical protein
MSGKTLRELWEENNCQPFWAKGEDNTYFYMQAISLSGDWAFGSNEFEKGQYWHPDCPSWIPWHDPRKPVAKPKEKLVLWRSTSVAPGDFLSLGSLRLVPEGVDPNDEYLHYSWERVSLSQLLEGE